MPPVTNKQLAGELVAAAGEALHYRMLVGALVQACGEFLHATGATDSPAEYRIRLAMDRVTAYQLEHPQSLLAMRSRVAADWAQQVGLIGSPGD